MFIIIIKLVSKLIVKSVSKINNQSFCLDSFNLYFERIL